MPTPSESLIIRDQQQELTVKSTSAFKTRFIGKHSRDNRLSIFLNQRNSNSPTELLGLVRINRDALHLIQEKGATVIVGVMARLLCDHGLQFSEHFVYQRETTIYPLEAAQSCTELELVQGLLGDAVLPDEYHRGFKLKLPTALPPSCIFLSPDTSMGPGITGDSPWGLTYYLYAYLSTQPHHRKSSKVFLSFTRAIPSNPTHLVQEAQPPAVKVSRSSNLRLVGSNKPLTLHAALDRSFFYTGDQMAVHVRIENPKSINFAGIRITLKQLITIRALNQGRQVIKVPLGAYEFKSIDANGKFQRSVGNPCNPKDFPFLVDTIRINLKPGTDLQHVTVESLLPRNSIKSLILCPSFSQTYEMQDNPLKYFSIEYYMNVHVVMPWGTNLIAKLPFTVASRGVTENNAASNSQSNSLIFDDFSANNDDDYVEKEKLMEQSRRASIDNKTAEAKPAQVDFKIVKCDMDRALQIFDKSRSVKASSLKINPDSFVQMRRTWVREFCEAFSEISSYLDQLDNLLQVAVTSLGNKYVSGFPVELVRSLFDKFIPIYTRFLHLHDLHDRQPALEDALAQFLDTLELVLMKFHLLSSRDTTSASTDAIEINSEDLFDVLQGRLRKESEKLTLVVPGMIEWRWLLEELYFASQTPQSHQDQPDQINNSLDEMAQMFQSFHSRLSESFSDSQIDSQEIFKYSQLIFSSTCLSVEAYTSHYKYFKIAFLVYFGNFQDIFLNFDKNFSEQHEDLKILREKLKTFRQELIETMIKCK